MTVSRRGKRGTRAGHMIPESRNRRVLRNAGLKRQTKSLDERPSRNKKTREEWVIALVTRVVGTTAGPGHCEADEIASDVILHLLDVGGFSWEEEEIIDFCRKKAFSICKSYMFRRETPECDFAISEKGLTDLLTKLAGTYSALQPVVVDAKNAIRRLMALPNKHRTALAILCDGGNPIDVAEEMEITPWEAIRLIKEAREYIDRVDPIDEAA